MFQTIKKSLLLLLLKDNPSFNEIGVGATSRQNVGRRLILGNPLKTAPSMKTL